MTAPVGLITNDRPEHTVPLLTVMVGVMSTVMVLTAVLILTQPAVLVPVTEYEVVTPGLTVNVLPEMVYVPPPAPDGIIVKDSPEQILPLVTAMVGAVCTVTLLTAVFELTHPSALVPIIV